MLDNKIISAKQRPQNEGKAQNKNIKKINRERQNQSRSVYTSFACSVADVWFSFPLSAKISVTKRNFNHCGR